MANLLLQSLITARVVAKRLIKKRRALVRANIFSTMIDRVGTSRRKIHGVFSSTEGKRYPEGNALAEKRTPSRYERIPTCFDDIRSFAVGFSMEKEAA